MQPTTQSNSSGAARKFTQIIGLVGAFVSRYVGVWRFVCVCARVYGFKPLKANVLRICPYNLQFINSHCLDLFDHSQALISVIF